MDREMVMGVLTLIVLGRPLVGLAVGWIFGLESFGVLVPWLDRHCCLMGGSQEAWGHEGRSLGSFDWTMAD